MSSKAKRSRVDADTVSVASNISSRWRKVRAIDTIHISDVSPEKFYEEYVQKRIPVKILGFGETGEIDVAAWELKALQKRCGNSIVHIEKRDPKTKTFGTGVKEPQKFQQFLHALQNGADDQYLTTQPIPDDDDGLPLSVFASPITEMISSGCMQSKPSIAGNLIPANVNVWMGRSTSGSSSNLHHDFHDNIYFVIRGKKRFTVAAPCFAKSMYLNGIVNYVHPNGLINYETCATREDGVPPHIAVNSLKARKAPKAVIQEAEHALHEALKRDKAYAASLEDHLTDSDGESVEDTAAAAADMWAALEASSTHTSSKKATQVSAKSQPKKAVSDEVDAMWAAMTTSKNTTTTSSIAATLPSATLASTPNKSISSMPDHFSKVSLPALREEVNKHVSTSSKRKLATSIQETETVKTTFPLFADVPLLEIDILEHEMLYLPASWFHEVVSYNNTSADESAGIHIAVNYWFYPPSTRATATSGNFKQPYDDDYWADVMKRKGLSTK